MPMLGFQALVTAWNVGGVGKATMTKVRLIWLMARKAHPAIALE